jgi:hypothetical protein
MNYSFLGVDDSGFLEERVKTYLTAPMSPLNSPGFFLFSAVKSEVYR